MKRLKVKARRALWRYAKAMWTANQPPPVVSPPPGHVIPHLVCETPAPGLKNEGLYLYTFGVLGEKVPREVGFIVTDPATQEPELVPIFEFRECANERSHLGRTRRAALKKSS